MTYCKRFIKKKSITTITNKVLAMTQEILYNKQFGKKNQKKQT